MARRSSTVSAGLGLSSISFWWRRCTEQSRSPRCTTFPCESPMHLDLDVARVLQVLLDVHRRRCRTPPAPRSAPARTAARTARSFHAMRMPFPPPPAVALMMTGKPIPSATCSASSGSSMVPSEPGTVGTPASFASRRAVALSPICRIWSARGPDERDVRRPAGLGELGVLRQEAVARVDRVGAGDLGGGDDVGDAQVGQPPGRAARCRRRRRRSGRAATPGRPRCRPRPSRHPARGRRG